MIIGTRFGYFTVSCFLGLGLVLCLVFFLCSRSAALCFGHWIKLSLADKRGNRKANYLVVCDGGLKRKWDYETEEELETG